MLELYCMRFMQWDGSKVDSAGIAVVNIGKEIHTTRVRALIENSVHIHRAVR